MSNYVLTPACRIVMGSVSNPNRTDSEGNPLVIKSGKNAGKPREDYFIGVAIRKDNPGYDEFLDKLMSMAKSAFRTIVSHDSIDGLPENFSFNIIDGDSEEETKSGYIPCEREGFRESWIIPFNNGFKPKCYVKGGLSRIEDESEIKRGHWIRINAKVAFNTNVENPRMYLNHQDIELIKKDKEITPPKNVFAENPFQDSLTTPNVEAQTSSNDDNTLYQTPDGKRWTLDELKSQGYDDDLISSLKKFKMLEA
jgi:hypothetical protein